MVKVNYEDNQYDWIHKLPREGKPDTSENGSNSTDKLFEKIIGGSYHRRRKIQQRGEQVSSECINMLTETHKEQVWPDRLQKSPSWESDDDVTGEIKEWVGTVIEMEDPMWDSYSNVPMAAGLTVKQHIKESLTQHHGWSLNSVSERLRKDFPQLSKFERERIARQEVSGVLNKSKMTAIAARKGDPLVRWVGPDDDDTTELCNSLSEATKDGVPFSEFTDMLVSHAKEYGGTPNRAESGLPHMQCRYTVEIVDE